MQLEYGMFFPRRLPAYELVIDTVTVGKLYSLTANSYISSREIKRPKQSDIIVMKAWVRSKYRVVARVFILNLEIHFHKKLNYLSPFKFYMHKMHVFSTALFFTGEDSSILYNEIFFVLV